MSAKGQTRSFGDFGSICGLPESGHGWHDEYALEAIDPQPREALQADIHPLIDKFNVPQDATLGVPTISRGGNHQAKLSAQEQARQACRVRSPEFPRQQTASNSADECAQESSGHGRVCIKPRSVTVT
jgi:hypothetical protein